MADSQSAWRWRWIVFILVGAAAVFSAVGFLLYFALSWLEDDTEVARIAGSDGLEIVILDTSRGATTGFSYAFDVVPAGSGATRDHAVAFLSGPKDVTANWTGATVLICADSPRIWHYQNFYVAQDGDNFREGDVLLRSFNEC